MPAPNTPYRTLNWSIHHVRLIRDRSVYDDDAGFTLIELLVASALALVLFTAITTLMIDGLHDQTTLENRSSQLQQAELAIQGLVRNLRQATSVTVNTSSSITYSEPVSTGTETVAFSCSTTTGTCTQTVGSVKKTMVTGVDNTAIFTATPTTSPTFIAITLSLATNGQTPVSVTDGTGLRNVTLGK